MALPNAANMTAAVAGMATEGNNMAQSVQRYNTHQQALGAELDLMGNSPVVQIRRDIHNLGAEMREGFLVGRAE
jgi:hypothetical protein